MTYRTLVDDLRAQPSLLASEDEFVARVMESCKRSETVGASRESKSARPIAITVLAAAAAIAVVSVGRTRMRDQWTARGSSHHEIPGVSVQVLLARDNALLPIEDSSLRAGDGIAVRCANGVGERRFLAVFAIDAAKAVHWIYPAYVDESSNPTSIALDPSDTPRVLEEIVEPDRPAAGPFRVVALTSREPMSVKAIEKRLAGGGESIADLFPEGQVQEWRCLWTSR